MTETKPERKLARGERVEIKIEALTPTGAGISKDLGIPLFIERVAPGDVVDAEIFDIRKDFARARVVQIVKPGPGRQEPPCPIFKVCGGCQWQHLTYESQLEAKTDIVVQAIEHIGKLERALVRPTVGAPHALRYRNKVQFPVRQPKNSKRILAGYFKQDSHELVNVKYCPIQPEPLDRMLNAAKEIAERYQFSAYDETTGKGVLRHINARASFSAGTVLLTVVLNWKARDEKDFMRSAMGEKMVKFAADVSEEVPEIAGVCVNLNTERGNKILGDQTFCISGEPYIEERLGTSRQDLPAILQRGITFRLSSTSFFQVNSEQAVRLLEEVYDAAAAAGKDERKPLIVDAFSGVGTMSFWLAPLAREVVAIEEHGAAVSDGRGNAERNGIDNVRFLEGQVETVLPELIERGERPDIIVLDPPRKGLSPTALAAICASQAPLVIYVSCNPATLARDLKLLAEGGTGGANGAPLGYKTKQIQPVDLFPQTYHVESVTVLERRDS